MTETSTDTTPDRDQRRLAHDWPVYAGFAILFLGLGTTMVLLTDGTGTVPGFTRLESVIGVFTTYTALAMGLSAAWQAIRGWRARRQAT